MKLNAGMVAVVTGGASGIGFCLARALLDRGLSVVIGDIEQAALDGLADLTPPERILLQQVDVSKLEDIVVLRDATLSHFGKIDVVFNNAGISIGIMPMWEVDMSEWKWVMDVCLWGVINGIHVFLPTLMAQGSGHIVNTASLGGLI
jgi:NADP-dependent 3-hydroxy acid dehydrogenase YdfG